MGFLGFIGIFIAILGIIFSILGIGGMPFTAGSSILITLTLGPLLIGLGIYIFFLGVSGFLVSTGLMLIVIGIGTIWLGGSGIIFIIIGGIILFFGFKRKYYI